MSILRGSTTGTYTINYKYETNWTGTLSFDENIATMTIEEDGRPGTVTFEIINNELYVEYDIEEAPADADFTPWSGQGSFSLRKNYKMTNTHF